MEPDNGQHVTLEPSNGQHVTWRELNLALKPIQDGISRIEQRLNTADEHAWLGIRGRNAWQNVVTGGSIALVAAAVSLIARFAF